MVKKIGVGLVVFIMIFLGMSIDLVSVEKKGDKVEQKVLVYYFYWNPRCMTCNKIEKQVKEALDQYFKTEQEQGVVVFKAVDVGQDENKHFEKDYNLYAKSVVLSKVVKGKEVQKKILQKVWELVHKTDSYYQYVKTNVEDFLK